VSKKYYYFSCGINKEASVIIIKYLMGEWIYRDCESSIRLLKPKTISPKCSELFRILGYVKVINHTEHIDN